MKMELDEETDLKEVEGQKHGERRMSGIDRLTGLTGPAGSHYRIKSVQYEIPTLCML